MTHDPTPPRSASETGASVQRGVEPDAFGPDALAPDDGGADADGAELDALMIRLRGIAEQVDAPPQLVTDLARAAFETRDLDAELAVLTADSDVDTLALTRATETVTPPRMVSFEADSVTVELQLDLEGDTLTVRGFVGGVTGVVQIDTGHHEVAVEPDDRGWFMITGVAVGRLRVRATGVDGSSVATAWITT